MARPRNDSAEPKVRDRLLEAFWHLLETHHLCDITVGMITEEARCNRGTFYYHYADIDALMHGAVASLLIGDHAVPRTIFELVADAEASGLLTDTVLDQRFHRFALIMQEAEMRRVDAAVKDAVRSLWRAALRPDGGELELETELVIEYTASGVLGLIARAAREEDGVARDEHGGDGGGQSDEAGDSAGDAGDGAGDGRELAVHPSPVIVDYLKQVSALSLKTICHIQGIDKVELCRRLRTISEENNREATYAVQAAETEGKREE